MKGYSFPFSRCWIVFEIFFFKLSEPFVAPELYFHNSGSLIEYSNKYSKCELFKGLIFTKSFSNM